MLIKIFSLYIQSLIYTTILVGLADGFWLLLQRLGRKDRTLVVGQSQIYDLLLITIMTIPILSFAIFGLLVVLKA